MTDFFKLSESILMRRLAVHLLNQFLPPSDHVQHSRTQHVHLGSILVPMSVMTDIFAWEAVCGYLSS